MIDGVKYRNPLVGFVKLGRGASKLWRVPERRPSVSFGRGRCQGRSPGRVVWAELKQTGASHVRVWGKFVNGTVVKSPHRALSFVATPHCRTVKSTSSSPNTSHPMLSVPPGPLTPYKQGVLGCSASIHERRVYLFVCIPFCHIEPWPSALAETGLSLRSRARLTPAPRVSPKCRSSLTPFCMPTECEAEELPYLASYVCTSTTWHYQHHVSIINLVFLRSKPDNHSAQTINTQAMPPAKSAIP